MSGQSLADALRPAESPAAKFRAAGGHVDFPNVPREYSHWIEEQRAWRETCVLADLSHHQMDQHIEGPDAIRVLSDLCVNSFEGFEVGHAKQPVMCNPDGKIIGDGILQRISEDELVLSGSPAPAPWLQYNWRPANTSPATITTRPPPFTTDPL